MAFILVNQSGDGSAKIECVFPETKMGGSRKFDKNSLFYIVLQVNRLIPPSPGGHVEAKERGSRKSPPRGGSFLPHREVTLKRPNLPRPDPRRGGSFLPHREVTLKQLNWRNGLVGGYGSFLPHREVTLKRLFLLLIV